MSSDRTGLLARLAGDLRAVAGWSEAMRDLGALAVDAASRTIAVVCTDPSHGAEEPVVASLHPDGLAFWQAGDLLRGNQPHATLAAALLAQREAPGELRVRFRLECSCGECLEFRRESLPGLAAYLDALLAVGRPPRVALATLRSYIRS